MALSSKVKNVFKCHFLRQAKLLGKVREEVARTLDNNGVGVYNRELDPCFVWVLDFPLFVSGDDDRLESCHHPFTAPRESDKELLITDPSKAFGDHFDLVLNGEEVGGGSIRIHDASIQKHVLQSILGITDIEEKMGYFLEALESGCPPHGGIALGLDRLITFMCPSALSIRDVIAFPKSNGCHDIMTGAPTEIDAQTKSLYHLQTREFTTVSGAACSSSGCRCQADDMISTQVPAAAHHVVTTCSSSSSSPTLPSPPSSLIKEAPETETEVKRRDSED